MPLEARYSDNCDMMLSFAHSEQTSKSPVRQKRRATAKDIRYDVDMRLRITELRKERGLTVEALATMAGVSKSYLSEMASGKKPINSNRLESVARALDVSPVDLIDQSSVPTELLTHIKTMGDLSEEDRLAVLRHAESLAKRAAEAG